MSSSVISFIVGFIFSIGLGLSKMTQPQKVISFLDIFGNWDPSLMFVMIGGILSNMIFYKLTIKKTKPLFGDIFHLPTNRDINKKLILGSALFGVGWGLAGFCPGPALTSLVSLKMDSFIFVIAMIVGMRLFSILDKKFQSK